MSILLAANCCARRNTCPHGIRTRRVEIVESIIYNTHLESIREFVTIFRAYDTFIICVRAYDTNYHNLDAHVNYERIYTRVYLPNAHPVRRN